MTMATSSQENHDTSCDMTMAKESHEDHGMLRWPQKDKRIWYMTMAIGSQENQSTS